VTSLDLGGLMLVASRTLNLDEDALLRLANLGVAESVLVEARPRRDRTPEEAAAQLLHGLVRRRVFGPRSAEVAVMAALQLLALNGREVADLGPPEQVRKRIADIQAGQIGVGEVAQWLSSLPPPAAAQHKGRLLPWRGAAGKRTEGTMFERFTDRARNAVELAQEEARRLDHNHIGTEHLLLGLLGVSEGVATEVLATHGVALDAARVEVERIVSRGPSTPRGHIPFTPRAKKVLELGLREAKQLHHNYIGTEHILLGLLREGQGVAAEVLAARGVDLSDVRQEVASLVLFMGRGEGPSREGIMREITAVFDEVERLRAEVARLAALLREHGIEPGGGRSRSA